MEEQALLHFWAIGDLHFRAWEQWLPMHTPRMTQMFDDLHSLWQQEGLPAFCVAPGDLVDKGAPQHYALAKRVLSEQLGTVPLYPGLGNHEFQPDGPEDLLHTGAEFSAAWGRPVRYSWTAGVHDEIICLMLDQPDPFLPGERRENPHVIFSAEALAFLDETLTHNAARLAIVFAHCPLHNTVLDRDPQRNMDDDSLDPFFFVENSEAVRAILAHHANAAFYISGHTHSGWGSPQLLFNETVGDHTVTHLNLMSPWYTGRFAGPSWNADHTQVAYRADTPDVLASFSFHIYPNHALIRVRDHKTRSWLAQWEVNGWHDKRQC